MGIDCHILLRHQAANNYFNSLGGSSGRRRRRGLSGLPSLTFNGLIVCDADNKRETGI
jgi:hypothetical protein